MIAIIIALPRVIYNAVQTITANASGTRERPVNTSPERDRSCNVGYRPLAGVTRHQRVGGYRHRCVLAGRARLAVLNVVPAHGRRRQS